MAKVEALHLTEYEIQVLLGCSIHGCNMSPDRVFSLHVAWHHLHAIGLIDRTDGLAIVTDDGKEVISHIIAALSYDAVAGGEEVQPVAVVVGHHVTQGPNVEFLTDNLAVGTKLYVSPTTELDALRKRVAELEKALEPFAARAELLDGKWLDHETHWSPAYGSTEITIGDLRTAHRVREGGKVDV